MNKSRLRLHQERGALPIGAIIGVAIVGAVIFVAIQLFPIYWGYWDFKSKAEESVTYVFVRYQQREKEKLEGEILGLLHDIKAEYEDDQVVIKVDRQKKRASIEVWYSRSHKVPFIENPLQFYVAISTP